MKFPKLLM